MINAKLPKFLNYKKTYDLIRLGSINDGGYLLSSKDINETELLLTFGIDTNWDFENSFHSLKNTPVISYDGSTKLKLFIKKSIIYFIQMKFIRSFLVLLKYFSLIYFYRGKNKLIQKFVGLGSIDNSISLESVLKKTRSKKIFIKMDIESSEYRCLDALLYYQNQLTGLVIEFHDFDLHLEKIKKFISKFKLNIVHIHANNNSSLSQNKIPTIIEISFSKYSKLSKNKVSFPHKLDSPNNKNLKEYKIYFA